MSMTSKWEKFGPGEFKWFNSIKNGYIDWAEERAIKDIPVKEIWPKLNTIKCIAQYQNLPKEHWLANFKSLAGGQENGVGAGGLFIKPNYVWLTRDLWML